MKLKINVWFGCGAVFAFFGLLPLAQAQTKIMEYRTAIPWSDSGVFLQAGAIPIGTDFLAIIVSRAPESGTPSEDQILYILDLKRKSLVQKFDESGRGYYWLNPSATTGSFVLSYWSGADRTDGIIELYNFNKRTRKWSLAIQDQVDTGYATAPSAPVLPGYLVNTVRGGDKLELHVFRY